MYKRYSFSRRIHRYRRQFICLYLPSMAAALLFSMMPVAVLLRIANTDAPGPAGRVCDSSASPSSSFYHFGQEQTGAPDPGSIASGADLETPGEEL